MLSGRYSVLVSHLEVFLSAIGLEESLTGTIHCPDLVQRVEQFCADIPSTSLLIHPSVSLCTVFPRQTQIEAEIRTGETSIACPIAPQPVEIDLET